MSQVISLHPDTDFKERSRTVLNDPGQRKNFRGAMDFLQDKRRNQFPDQGELAGLRELGASIRRYSLARLPQLLEQLEKNLTANVIQVHWAETDIGLSGVNFAVAETGTLCLVENEGNDRMCTTIPKVHIAVTGIEKVVENRTYAAAVMSIDALGQRPVDHDLLQHDQPTAPAGRKRRP